MDKHTPTIRTLLVVGSNWQTCVFVRYYALQNFFYTEKSIWLPPGLMSRLKLRFDMLQSTVVCNYHGCGCESSPRALRSV